MPDPQSQTPIQPSPDHRGTAENGPFNPPKEFVQVTRGKRGGKKPSFIINGKRVEETQ